MKAHISTNFEASIYIFSEGIVERFLAWFNTLDQSGWGYDYPSNFEGTFDLSMRERATREYRTFTVGHIWTFQIPDPEHYHPIHSRSEITNTLILHVYPNLPMQSLAEELPKFLKALGIEEFELRVPRYEKCVKDAVDYLLENSRHENN